MNIQSLGRKNKQLLVIIVVLNLAMVSVYVFLFLGVKTKNEHISNLLNEIESEATAENVQNSTKALVAETSALREKLKGYLVGKDDAVSFLELLEKMGGDAGATVAIDAVMKGGLDQPEAEELRIALVATGTWSSIIHYIGLLELLPLQVKVEQLVVTKTDKQGEEPWRGDITLLVLKAK